MFDEGDFILNILIFIKFASFILLIIFACIYALPLCLLSRFHSPINIMTVHLCLAFISSAIFWIIVYMLDLNQTMKFNIISQQRCSLLSSIETMINCLVIYSLSTVAINRFCSINYSNKNLFKSQRWAFVCIGITWLITLITSSLILVPSNTETCFEIFGNTYILQIYTLLIIVVFPAIVFVLINVFLFGYIRRSSRRIQANMSSARIISNNRDIRLVKHMIIMFIIFLGGWLPIYIFVCIDFNGTAPSVVYRVLSILPALSLLGDIIDLFLYNHPLRLYFRQLFTFRNNRIQPITTRS